MRLFLLISIFCSTLCFSQDKIISENYAIEGMMCGAMCVVKVEEAVSKLDGFKAVKFDFDEDRKEDYAIITFDNAVLSQKDLITAIEGSSHGTYKVNTVKEACCDNFSEHTHEVLKEKI